MGDSRPLQNGDHLLAPFFPDGGEFNSPARPPRFPRPSGSSRGKPDGGYLATKEDVYNNEGRRPRCAKATPRLGRWMLSLARSSVMRPFSVLIAVSFFLPSAALAQPTPVGDLPVGGISVVIEDAKAEITLSLLEQPRLVVRASVATRNNCAELVS